MPLQELRTAAGPGTFNVSGTHTYLAAGTYTLSGAAKSCLSLLAAHGNQPSDQSSTASLLAICDQVPRVSLRLNVARSMQKPVSLLAWSIQDRWILVDEMTVAFRPDGAPGVLGLELTAVVVVAEFEKTERVVPLQACTR